MAAPPTFNNLGQTQAATITQTRPNSAERNKGHFIGIGIAETILGVACFILGGVLFSPIRIGFSTYPGSGIWGGIMYVTSGGIAIWTGIKCRRWNLITGMTVSIFASITAFVVLVIDATGATIATICGDPCQTAHGIHTAIALLSSAEMICAIIHSAFCCSHSCCESEAKPTVISTTITTQPYVTAPVLNAYPMPVPLNPDYQVKSQDYEDYLYQTQTYENPDAM